MRYIFGQVWLIRKFHSCRICSHCIQNAYVTISSFSLYFAVSATGLVSMYTWLTRCLATGAHRPYLHSPSSCPYLWQPITCARGTLDDELVNNPGAAKEGKTHRNGHCQVVLFHLRETRSLARTINKGTHFSDSILLLSDGRTILMNMGDPEEQTNRKDKATDTKMHQKGMKRHLLSCQFLE